STFEAQPHREEMTEHGPATSHDGHVRPPVPRYQNRYGSLGPIEQKGGCRQALAARAQDIGCANIAGSYLADIAEACSFCQHESERHRAQQIAKNRAHVIRPGVGEPAEQTRQCLLRRREYGPTVHDTAHDAALDRVAIEGRVLGLASEAIDLDPPRPVEIEE